jgi:polysaccharide pyruvyl transferase WcaK-like protein
MKEAIIKNKKILLINAMGLYNYGGRAVMKGAIKSLQDAIPDVQIDVMSTHYKDECDIYEKWNYENLKLIEHVWFEENKSGLKNILCSVVSAPLVLLKFLSYRYLHDILPIKNPYQQYDIIVDMSTDGLNDHYGFFMPIFFMFNILLAKIANKKIVTCAASIGKFDRLITKTLAKFVLNKVDLITPREEITEQYLHEIGINRPRIELTADHAFIMDPSSSRRIDQILLNESIYRSEKPMIGISPSQPMYEYAFSSISDRNIRYKEYVDKMASTIDFIIENLNGMVVLVSHTFTVSNENDFSTSKEIYGKVVNKDMLKLITGEYDADELKGVIGRCDIFIGCRMHATVASTSMGIPTIAVAYGHKFHGVIGKMMGQEKRMIDIKNYTPDEFLSEMKSQICYVWNNRNKIRIELEKKAIVVKEKAFLNGKLVKELMFSS